MSSLPSDMAQWPVFRNASSEAARAFLARDWSATSLGPVSSWSPALRTTLSMVLHTDQPMLLYCGPSLVLIYNDAFIPSFGRGKHPAAMGQPGNEAWIEAWAGLEPFVDDVMTHGKSSWFEDALVPVWRNGRLENVWWTYGYSPVYDASGQVAACLTVVTETTGKIIARRRLQALQSLSRQTTSVLSTDELFRVAADYLGSAEVVDFPFVLIYTPSSSDPVVGGLDADQAKQVTASIPPVHEPGMLSVQVRVEGYPWTEPVRQCVVAKVELGLRGAATLVVGVSPRISFDTGYQRLVDQVCEHLTSEVRRIEAYRVRSLIENERNELMLQAPIAMALTVGPEHVFRLANARYHELAGTSDLLGKSYREAFPGIEDTPIMDIVDGVYRTGQPFSADEMCVPADRLGTGEDQEYWFTFALQPIRIDGKIEGMMVVASEITAQVLARRVLEAGHAERKRLISDLEAASRAKDEFLAMLGHELRNPLSPILTATELLRLRRIPDIDKERGIIERQARHMVRLIDDLLDISRITGGKLTIDVMRVDVADVISRAVEQVRPLMSQRNHDLQVVTTPGLVVAGDEGRLAQVVSNLLVNAARYTDSGGKIRVETELDGSTIQVRITDNGTGIEPDRIDSLFLAFAQEQRSLQGSGLGLGLAIVKSLVEAHGGTVRLHSDGLGHGTEAVVRLPCATASVRTGFTPQAAPPRVATGHEVWVVDDNVDAAEMMRMGLSELGYTVRIANDGPTALELATRARPAVALLDLGLPEMDGYALAAKLTALPGWDAVPLVAVTGFGQQSDRERTAEAGFRDHLVKPVDLDTVDTTIRSLVDI